MASSNVSKQTAELARNRQKAGLVKEKLRLEGIKSAEAPVVTGIVEGASEAVKVWAPHQMTGVETPPNRPGLAVIKRVSATEAEPGDTVTYVIFYRNMGNTPIRSRRDRRQPAAAAGIREGHVQRAPGHGLHHGRQPSSARPSCAGSSPASSRQALGPCLLRRDRAMMEVRFVDPGRSTTPGGRGRIGGITSLVGRTGSDDILEHCVHGQGGRIAMEPSQRMSDSTS